ncbi:MAG: hypothetical protein QOF82_2994 [Frankiales bacterium]|nr:hypothetical protein [Frankiales bacterium]MDX6213907.1 hypothetical protein [Frankiales bacterium]
MTDLRSLPMINVVAAAPVADLAVVRDLTVVVVPAPTAASRYVMGLLADRVPLSLLCDLADPAGPASADIASSEQDSRSPLGDLMGFRARAAEGSGPSARARAVLRTLGLG